MATCEACWDEAYLLSRIKGTLQADEYTRLVNQDTPWHPVDEDEEEK